MKKLLQKIAIRFLLDTDYQFKIKHRHPELELKDIVINGVAHRIDIVDKEYPRCGAYGSFPYKTELDKCKYYAAENMRGAISLIDQTKKSARVVG